MPEAPEARRRQGSGGLCIVEPQEPLRYPYYCDVKDGGQYGTSSIDKSSMWQARDGMVVTWICEG
jgi:hypothetical protein